MTMHTWKPRSCLPTSWAISWTKCEKGCLHMRSSVLFWNWHISWRATVPGQYFWGLFSGHRALPPTMGQRFFLACSSPAGSECPVFAAIYLVGDDPGNCPTSSNFLASSLLLFILTRVGGLWWCLGLQLGLHLGLVPHSGLTSLLPTSRYDLGSCHTGMENQPIRGLGGLVGRHVPFSFTKQVMEVLRYSFTNGRQMESHFKHFGERREGIPGSHESRGRYYFSFCYFR